MNGTWKRQLHPFITPCLVLLDFNQVFVKSLQTFAQTLQIHIKSHTQKSCAGAHSRQRLETKNLIESSCPRFNAIASLQLSGSAQFSQQIDKLTFGLKTGCHLLFSYCQTKKKETACCTLSVSIRQKRKQLEKCNISYYSFTVLLKSRQR